jgi:hypothetical protein
MRGVCNAKTWTLYPRKGDPAPILQETGRAPGPVRICAENLFVISIKSPDGSACSSLLQRLHASDPQPSP